MGNEVVARKRVEIPPRIREWLKAGGQFPPHLTLKLHKGNSIDFEVLDRDGNGCIADVGNRVGHKGFTLRVRNRLNNRISAAKICLIEDYTSGKLEEEMILASEIDDRAPVVNYEFVGAVDKFPDQPEDGRWLCFISRWIDGETLEHLLKHSPDTLHPELALLVLNKLLQAVLYLEQKGLKHDDLHLGNVMLSERPAEVRASDPTGDRYTIDIIDLGSMKRQDTPTAKVHDDRSSYAACIAKIHNCLHQQRHIAARYPALLQRLFEFGQRLAEEDPSRQFLTLHSAFEPLDAAKRALHSSLGAPSDGSLESPFAAISAEHLASDRILLQLFVDNLGWLESVRESTPTVLTGPRGCGKSMVFRYLALRTHLATPDAAARALQDLRFVGVYIGCASDLQNDLLWIKRQANRAEELAPQIATFFNLVAARELFRTLSMAAQNEVVGKVLGIDRTSVAGLIRFASEELNLPSAQMAVTGLDPGQSMSDELDRQRIRLARAMLEGKSPDVELPETFLRDLTRAAVKLMPGLNVKPIVFLLDDYTQQRIGEKVQAVLNPILWQRDAACAFKISCEPFGFSNTHINDAKVDQNREYIEVDTGRRMHTGAPAEAGMRRNFVAGLIDKRLEAAGYKGRVTELIGSSEYEHDTDLAIAIRRSGQGKSFPYHGLHVLANAWSGDVATVLFMVREMFQLAHVDASTTARISKQHQHEAIVSVSKALVERVTYCHPFGDEMRGVLDMFARLARRLLLDGPPQKDGDSTKDVPQRRYRLEVVFDEEGGIVDQLSRLTMSEHAGLLYKELIRRSIFIDLGESRSKDQKRTFRIQIRSSLLPHYGTSLVRKNYMAVHNLQEFCLLLNRSPEFETRVWKRGAEAAIGSMNDLFGEGAL